jgi:hypothetical protein
MVVDINPIKIFFGGIMFFFVAQLILVGVLAFTNLNSADYLILIGIAAIGGAVVISYFTVEELRSKGI